jgi:hypothetical protein
MATFQKIVVLDDEMQAQFVDSVLTDQDIPHVMRSYRDSALDGLFQGPHGWGHVEAPEEYRDQINRIVKDLSRPADEDTE